jgi:hypothetical protein
VCVCARARVRVHVSAQLQSYKMCVYVTHVGLGCDATGS